MLNHQRLKCYEMSMDIAKRVPSLIRTWPKGSAYLVDQLKRAVSSIILNIAEGNGRSSQADRKRFFGIARGSAAEVSAVMDVAFALEMINQNEYNYYQDRLIQIVKMLYKLK